MVTEHFWAHQANAKHYFWQWALSHSSNWYVNRIDTAYNILISFLVFPLLLCSFQSWPFGKIECKTWSRYMLSSVMRGLGAWPISSNSRAVFIWHAFKKFSKTLSQVSYGIYRFSLNCDEAIFKTHTKVWNYE